MKKEELIELIDSLKIDKNEYWILSSGALVLRGIYEDAGDLDIAVTYKGLEQLKKNYTLKEKQNGWYIVNKNVECVCDGNIEDLEYKPEIIDNKYQVQNIYDYLRFIRASKREKDKARIELIEDYIKNNY